MINSIANINAALVDIKTATGPLTVKLHQAGFDTSMSLGHEGEYTVSSLLNHIDTLAIQFLTITANRNQFIQRTSFSERQDIQSCLQKLFICLKQTSNTLDMLHEQRFNIIQDEALSYRGEDNNVHYLILAKTIEYIDLLKPYSRMLELVIAQERIHALSAVLETLLHKDNTAADMAQDADHDLAGEHSALELSNYLIKQAL